MVQLLRIHLLMQGTGVQSLVWEDPTQHRATKPMSHNFWARECLEPRSANTEKPPPWEAHTPQLESGPCSWRLVKAHRQQPRPSATKNNKQIHFLKEKENKATYKFYNLQTCCTSDLMRVFSSGQEGLSRQRDRAASPKVGRFCKNTRCLGEFWDVW